MEDAHTTLLKLEPSSANAFFAVFDGHGGTLSVLIASFRQCISSYSFLLSGSSVAKYAGQHVAERLASDSAYIDGDYKTAMKRAFLGTDEDLRAGGPPHSISSISFLTEHIDPAFYNDPSGCTAVAALVTADRKLYVVRLFFI
jgi:protein phosphatase 2C family protein 2/3